MTQAGQAGQQVVQPRLVATLGQEAESLSMSAAQETKLEPLSKGAETDDLEGDVEAFVPVIVSLGDKERRSVTTEVPLKHILNGASCALEGTKNSNIFQAIYCCYCRCHSVFMCSVLIPLERRLSSILITQPRGDWGGGRSVRQSFYGLKICLRPLWVSLYLLGYLAKKYDNKHF